MINFDDINAVGMVSHGGQIALAMANAAKKMINTPNWEAFHYERMTDNSFELTGGIVQNQQGTKKWLEPHDSVIVSNSQIVEEFLKIAPDLNQNEALITLNDNIELNTFSGATLPNRNDNEMYLQLTLKLPRDPSARNQLLQTCHLGAFIFDAPIVACKLEN